MNKKKETFRLRDVTDHSGRSKVNESDFYEERIGCIATNVRTIALMDATERVLMEFIQYPDGRLAQMRLKTSTVKNIEETEDGITILTKNSVYILDKVEIPVDVYQDTNNLIELYLTNQGNKFYKGYYYDKDKKPHKLKQFVHTGMFMDTMLLGTEDECYYDGYNCRYYIHEFGTIEFYMIQDGANFLIHNESDKEMIVEFPHGAVWHIPAGESKQGLP